MPAPPFPPVSTNRKPPSARAPHTLPGARVQVARLHENNAEQHRRRKCVWRQRTKSSDMADFFFHPTGVVRYALGGGTCTSYGPSEWWIWCGSGGVSRARGRFEFWGAWCGLALNYFYDFGFCKKRVGISGGKCGRQTGKTEEQTFGMEGQDYLISPPPRL